MQFAHAFLWKYREKGLELAQLLGQPGIFLTCAAVVQPPGQSVGPIRTAAARPLPSRYEPTMYCTLDAFMRSGSPGCVLLLQPQYSLPM